MRIDAYATMDHWFDHVAAIWRHLEPDERGSFFMGGYDLCGAAARNNVTGQALHPPRSDRPILVSSWRDANRCIRVGRPVILMEHGVGQHFTGPTNPSYSGAPEHARLAMRLAPNAYAADRHRAAHPNVPVAVIGCPKLDDLITLPPPVGTVVALSNHWGDKDSHIPEMGGAWWAWHDHYKQIPVQFRGALGHAHPKLWPQMHTVLADYGFEPVRQFADVARRASVYVCDGVSTLYEFAALDRPVVVLNPPHYRKNVNHGGRFWDWADVGVQVDDPRDINDAITEALRETPERVKRRREIVAEVYPHLGQSGLRAVQALRDHFG